MTQNQLNLLHYWQMNGDVGGFVATTGTAIEDRDAVNNDHLVASSASAITFVDVGTDPNTCSIFLDSSCWSNSSGTGKVYDAWLERSQNSRQHQPH
jgi:hypothetical protein